LTITTTEIGSLPWTLMGRKCGYEVNVSGDGKVWTAKIVKEPKNTSWRQEIADEVLQAVRSCAVPTVEIQTDDFYKRYGKKIQKPEKSVAVIATKECRRYRQNRLQEKS
jgi:hypothetical protein